jgi:D-alanyl-D-alanine-carboxypeptidase/D-alanyl-D-alanine-endopeptidase
MQSFVHLCKDMKLRYWIMIAWVTILPVESIAADFGDLPADIRVQAQERIDEGFHLGTVIGVIDRSGRRFYGFGQTSMTDGTLPDKHSIFEIASITKGFTAILVADLEIDGRVSTTAPIGRYVPTLRRADTDAAQYVTLERLLTHTAGLPRNPTNTDDNDDDRYKNYSTEDLEAFLSSWTINPVAPSYSYSNAGLIVAEYAIETEIGRTYEDLMEERVLDKLGMYDTFFSVPNEKRDRLVTGFRNGVSTTEMDVGQYPAMGGLRSTADDMLTYLGAHIGLVPSPLSSAIDKTLEERFSNEEITLSLGWRISRNEESGKTIYHFTGGSTGFVSFAAFDRVNQKAVVVLVNGTRWFSDLGFKVLDPTYPLNDPEPRADESN